MILGSQARAGTGRWHDRWPLIAAALLLALNFALRYPGSVSFDAAKQYAQAVSGRYDDWHPPIMAFAWSLLRPIGGEAPSMLALQLVGHWLGIACIADGLARSGRPKAACAMLLSGASPLFLYYNGIIYKDVGLASALLAGFGIVFRFRVQGRAVPLPALALALLFIAYGTLVRTNAIFAFGPVLLYALADPRRLSGPRVAVLSLLLAVIALPVSSVVNHRVLEARPSGVTQTLELFDLAGIAYHSGDLSVMPPTARLSAAQLRTCYVPQYWDTLAMEFCGKAFDRLPAPGSPARDAVGRWWLSAIAHHPLAYAEHRLASYNALLNFFVPALQCRFTPFDASCGTPDPRTGRMMTTPDSARAIRWDYVKKNPLVWPVTWLALGIALAALFRGRSPTPALVGAKVLLASALFYGLAYLVVGVAGDLRYVYWSIVAIQSAAVLGWDTLYRRVRAAEPAALAALGIVPLVVAIGYVARFTDNQSLMVPDPGPAHLARAAR